MEIILIQIGIIVFICIIISISEMIIEIRDLTSKEFFSKVFLSFVLINIIFGVIAFLIISRIKVMNIRDPYAEAIAIGFILHFGLKSKLLGINKGTENKILELPYSIYLIFKGFFKNKILKQHHQLKLKLAQKIVKKIPIPNLIKTILLHLGTNDQSISSEKEKQYRERLQIYSKQEDELKLACLLIELKDFSGTKSFLEESNSA